jgi:putative hydrolase of the HAD superfamily
MASEDGTRLAGEDAAGLAAGPYRGLLVDWGGVMTSDVFDTFRAFCELEGLAPDAVGQRFREDRAARELLIGLETGQLQEEEFEPRFAAILGVPAPQLIDRMFAGGRSDERMVAAVARAREQGVKTGLISNSWGTRRYDRELLANLFDGIVISGEVGMRKPTPAIYELAAQRVGLAPRQCVFVDDLPFNLDPAQDLGMATVHHASAIDTIAQLERLLGVELG